MILPDKSSDETHFFSSEVSMRWESDGRICVLDLHSSSRSAIDVWYEAIKAIAQDWNPDQIFLAAYDLKDVTLTPYFKQRATDVANAVRHLQGRYAVIIGNDPNSETMRHFFDSAVKQQSSREGKIFPGSASALFWLQEAL